MIKFGLDARMIAHSGIGTYIRSLVSELAVDQRQDLDLTLYGPLEKLAGYSARKVSANFPIYSLREQFLFPSLLKKNHEKNLHSPHYNAPLGFNGNLVVTVHDLIHLRYPPSRTAYFYARTMLTAVCKKARAIIAVSEATRRDLVELLGVSEKKVRVIYHGGGVAEYPVPPNRRDTPFPKGNESQGDYILYVGIVKPHKNIPTLIEAFLKAKKKLGELKLMLAGKNFMPQLASRYGAEDGIRFLGEVSQGRLVELYQGARMLILPSLWEGFGFPVLEAMSFGVPVIASNTSSLPEIAGNAAVFFEPNSSDELAEKICELWQNQKLREELIQKGLVQAQKFSWQKCAEETLRVYRECFI